MLDSGSWLASGNVWAQSVEVGHMVELPHREPTSQEGMVEYYQGPCVGQPTPR